MTEVKFQAIQMRDVDRPEVSETFADSVIGVAIDNIGVAKIILGVTRAEPPKPNQQPTAARVTAARLVLTLPALVQLQQQLTIVLSQLPKAPNMPAAPASPTMQ